MTKSSFQAPVQVGYYRMTTGSWLKHEFFTEMTDCWRMGVRGGGGECALWRGGLSDLERGQQTMNRFVSFRTPPASHAALYLACLVCCRPFFSKAGPQNASRMLLIDMERCLTESLHPHQMLLEPPALHRSRRPHRKLPERKGEVTLRNMPRRQEEKRCTEHFK